MLRKNPLFINEPVFTDQLDAMAKHTLKQYALERLLVEGDNLPLLYIPPEEPVIRDANDWHDRFVAVRDTFSSRVGQICNAAFSRSVIAYDENSAAEERERYRQETETLAILVGLEIDAAKSGVRPDLDKYLKHKTVRKYSSNGR